MLLMMSWYCLRSDPVVEKIELVDDRQDKFASCAISTFLFLTEIQ